MTNKVCEVCAIDTSPPQNKATVKCIKCGVELCAIHTQYHHYNCKAQS